VWLRRLLERSRLYQRFRHLIHEMGKFGIVGGVAYVVDTALFVVLLLVMESLTAKTLATILAATIAFVGNRFWTWRHRARTSLAKEYGLYFTFNAIGLVIALGFLWISHYWLGSIWPAFQTELADVVAANVIGLGAGTAFRFWSYRRFVFKLPVTVPDPYDASLAPASPTRPGGVA
jgi:putative flippase GtrA